MAPVFIPVVPLITVPVMVFAVSIVPNPEAIEPDASAPTEVNEEPVTPEPKVVAFNTDTLLMLMFGVPLFTPVNANLAEAVAEDPSNRSTVLFTG